MFADQHFNNSKSFLVLMRLVLGDLLTKKPATKKFEQFMSSQISAKLDSLRLDAKIQKSFERINKRLQNRLDNLNSYLDNFNFEN